MVADYDEHRRVFLGVDGLYRHVNQPGQEVGQKEEEQRIVVDSLDEIRTPVHGAGLQGLQ